MFIATALHILEEQKANDDEFSQRKIRLMEDGAATAKELEDLQEGDQEAIKWSIRPCEGL
jgi:flagellar motor component MotA